MNTNFRIWVLPQNSAYHRIALQILLYGLVYFCWFCCIRLSAFSGKQSSRNKSLSLISVVLRFYHYSSEVWKKGVTGSLHPSTSATSYSFYCFLPGERVKWYNIELSQSIQNPHRLHEITLQVTSHREIFLLKSYQAEVFAPEEITEEAQPTRHCKHSVTHQIDTSSCFKVKPTVYLLASGALPSLLQPDQQTSWPHPTLQDWRTLLLDIIFSTGKRFGVNRSHGVFTKSCFVSVLIPGTFPCTCLPPFLLPGTYRSFPSCLTRWDSAITSTHHPGSLLSPSSNTLLSPYYIDFLQWEALCIYE